MATKKKLLQAAAGNAGGAGLNVEDVFSTYLNSDGSSNQVITNGIDLAGEGGLVWGKSRNLTEGFFLVDSVRGKGSNNNFKYLKSDSGAQELDIANRSLSSMNSNGFTFQGADAQFNASGNEYVYWTFLKSKRFFDIQTYTGDGNASKTLSHDLGAAVGCIIVKRTDNVSDWLVYHRSLTAANGTGSSGTTNAGQNVLRLNKTNNVNDSATYWNNTDATSTNFTVGSEINVSNASYVAYLFAHNDGDGEFGPDSDQDGIKCSHYVGDGTNDFSKEINVGFEPQFVIVKKTSETTDTTGWGIADAMRGFNTVNTNWLIANTSAAESTLGGEYIALTSTGFKVGTTTWNSNTAGYIYIAIRRGTAVPTSATEVFANQFGSASPQPWFKSLFSPDMALYKKVTGTGSWSIASRLTGTNDLNTNSTGAEQPNSSARFDFQNGFYANSGSTTDWMSWHWKRAKGAFDCVAYTGNGTNGRAISHNLGVAPEMMWIRPRSFADHWSVYHTANGNTKYMRLNTNGTPFTNTNIWNSTTPDASSFTLGSDFGVNGSGYPYIAYLFASLAGISKVGSYTGTGSNIDVDCGFSSGARFVLIKRADASSTGWGVIDTVRGLTSSTDAYLFLNLTDAEGTSDILNPLSSGFKVVATGSDWNANGGTYIFYAIA